jgi:hypothetical protein
LPNGSSASGQKQEEKAMTRDRKGISSSLRHSLGALTASVIVLATAPSPTGAQALEPAVVSFHERATTQLGALPEPGLKAVYLHCSREASQYALRLGEAAYCSIVYETLLRRIFGGDFHALLAWSSTQRDDPIGEGFNDALTAGNAQALQP